jgi:hypothetical protein
MAYIIYGIYNIWHMAYMTYIIYGIYNILPGCNVYIAIDNCIADNRNRQRIGCTLHRYPRGDDQPVRNGGGDVRRRGERREPG